jgi:hypothetical protein
MEGNLRLWRSSSGKTKQLKGHSIDVPSEDGGTQGMSNGGPTKKKRGGLTFFVAQHSGEQYMMSRRPTIKNSSFLPRAMQMPKSGTWNQTSYYLLYVSVWMHA